MPDHTLPAVPPPAAGPAGLFTPAHLVPELSAAFKFLSSFTRPLGLVMPSLDAFDAAMMWHPVRHPHLAPTPEVQAAHEGLLTDIHMSLVKALLPYAPRLLGLHMGTGRATTGDFLVTVGPVSAAACVLVCVCISVSLSLCLSVSLSPCLSVCLLDYNC